MRYRYQTGGCEYIVQLTDDEVRAPGPDGLEETVLVEFVARVNGGRGRMPNPRKVALGSLEPLVDYETARKLVKG